MYSKLPPLLRAPALVYLEPAGSANRRIGPGTCPLPRAFLRSQDLSSAATVWRLRVRRGASLRRGRFRGRFPKTILSNDLCRTTSLRTRSGPPWAAFFGPRSRFLVRVSIEEVESLMSALQ